MAEPLATATRITADIQNAARCPWIAAIDFGTSFCSLAYALSDHKVANLEFNQSWERVPTAILLEKGKAPNASLTVAKFGFQAQKEIGRLGTKLEEYVYFECFKMKLSQEEV